jgi:hypothetical protein
LGHFSPIGRFVIFFRKMKCPNKWSINTLGYSFCPNKQAVEGIKVLKVV